MKILVYGINYYPESIGIGKYSTEMCEWLAEQGNDVEVITAMPYYPYWKIIDTYKKKWWFTERIKNVKIHRCPLYVPTKVTGRSRIIHELSFGLASMVYWMVCFFRNYDVVICVAPPLYVGLAGVFYKTFHKTFFIYHIQDLQLDAAKQLGLIKSPVLLKLTSEFERFLLNNAHAVSSLSEGMSRNIAAKGVPAHKIIELRNWTDTHRMAPEHPGREMRESFNIEPSKKIALYSGNIGEKQGMEILIKVAEHLNDSNIVILVIGDGAYKRKFEESVASKGLANIKIFPLQPIEILHKVLNMADIHLVLQKKASADLVMPSKLTSILAVGGVAIVTAEAGTSLYEVIVKNKMAIIVEPENPEVLRDAIVENIGKDLSEYRKNARNYALTRLEKGAILTDFQNFMKSKIFRGI